MQRQCHCTPEEALLEQRLEQARVNGIHNACCDGGYCTQSMY